MYTHQRDVLHVDPRAAELAAGRKKMRLSCRKNCG